MRRKRFFILTLIFGVLIILIYFKSEGQSGINYPVEKYPSKPKVRFNGKQTEYVDKNGMHVVIGRYVGDSLSGGKPDLTWDELNANNYNNKGLGEGGEPVFLNSGENVVSKRLWHINKFNIMASDKISLDRTLQDVRKLECKNMNYNTTSLPDASVIIVFHNEAWSTLLRTVHSVINRTPSNLINEIILVDDASNKTFLLDPLDQHMLNLNIKHKIIRIKERVGLIQARLRGADKCSGKVMVFLDAHCEVTRGWLEPLLDRISKKREAVVCPVIDIINDDNFGYVKSFSLHWGAFNWELHFRWYTMSQQVLNDYRIDGTIPYKTPAMAGGLFAINREYFYEIGSYDEAMDIWGGENLEMSFRVWMCGGSVEISPCSHVGHVFRKASPYSFPRKGGVGKVLHANLARVALVWMDQFADFYFLVNPSAKEASHDVDVTSRLKLRENLQCHDFNWYLKNVWPQHFFPTSDRFYGQIIHRSSGNCIMKPWIKNFKGSTTSTYGTGPAILEKCMDGFYARQFMVLSQKPSGSNSAFIMSDEAVCLDSPMHSEDEATVRFHACNELPRQLWLYYPSNNTLIHSESRKCLSHPQAGTSDILTLQDCKSGSIKQQWILKSQSFN